MTAAPESQPRILIVDDNEDAAVTLGYLLGIAGFDVETAFSGPAALEIAAWFKPTACVLDINMPRMTGYELAGRLRDLSPARPPLLATMTAYEDEAHLNRAVDAGFDLQFTKPVSSFDIAEQLGDYLLKGDAEQLARHRRLLANFRADASASAKFASTAVHA